VPVQLLLAVVVPAAFGALCGWLLGVNKTWYLVLSILALLGGYAAGTEHRGAREGALRGVLGGALFGGAILLVKEATGEPPKADLPEPEILLLAVTTVISMVAAAMGATDRKRLEESENPPEGFSLKRLSWTEVLGFVAAAVLLLSLWLPWFTTNESNPNSVINSSGTPPGESATGWEVFRILDYVLAAACVAPFILAWIVARDADLSWKPGEVTMIVGITAVVLILCNGFILGKPYPGIEIGLSYGYPVALLGAAGLFVSGFLRQALHTDDKKQRVSLC